MNVSLTPKPRDPSGLQSRGGPPALVQPSWLQRNRRRLLIAGPLLLLLVATVIYLRGGRYVSTDDAYTPAARTDVSSNVAGRVVESDVQDNQPVSKGDVLLRIHDQPFTVAVAQAEAQLANVRLQVETHRLCPLCVLPVCPESAVASAQRPAAMGCAKHRRRARDLRFEEFGS